MDLKISIENPVRQSINNRRIYENAILDQKLSMRAPHLKRPKFDSINEVELIMLARDGNALSFEQLVKIHSGKLRNFIKKNSYDKSYVDDLFQETLLQALIGLKSFSGTSTFSTWLLGIAFNLIRNHYNRSPQYRHGFCSDDALEEYVCDLLNPEQYMEQFDRICEIQMQCDMLPERSRDVLSLYVMDGNSYEEISEKTGESVSAVKSRLFRSRVRIKEALEPYL